MNSTTKSKKKKWLLSSAAIVFWLGIWFLAAAAVDKELLLPSPAVVFLRLLKLVKTAAFWEKTIASLLRITGGFLLGCLFGVLFAGLATLSAIADALITPLVRTVRSMPVASFVILVMLFLNYSLVPVFIASLMVMPVVYLNLKKGMEERSPELLEVSKVFGFRRFQTFRYLTVPSVKPYFISGAVTALGLAWKSGIAAEVLCQPKNAIGGEIYYSRIYLETPDLFAWTVVVVLFSLLLEKLLEFATKSKRKDSGENAEKTDRNGEKS